MKESLSMPFRRRIFSLLLAVGVVQLLLVAECKGASGQGEAQERFTSSSVNAPLPLRWQPPIDLQSIRAASACARDIAEPKLSDHFHSSLVWLLAEYDSDWALAETRFIQDRERFKGALKSVYRKWAAYDANGAFDRALSMPEGDERNACILAVFDGAEPVEDAPAMAECLPEGDVRSQALLKCVERLANSNPSRAGAIMAGVAFSDSIKEPYVTALASLAAVDPEQIDALVPPELESVYEINFQLVYGFGKKGDMESGLKATAHQSAQRKDELLVGLAQGLCKSGKYSDAVSVVAKLTDQRIGNHVIRSISSGWIESNPNEARRWLDSLPEGEMRDEALTGACAGLARASQPCLAEALDIQDPKLLGTASAWSASEYLAKGDIESAKIMVETIPWEECSEEAFKAAFELSKSDPNAAFNLVLAAIDTPNYRSSALKEIGWNWVMGGRTPPHLGYGINDSFKGLWDEISTGPEKWGTLPKRTAVLMDWAPFSPEQVGKLLEQEFAEEPAHLSSLDKALCGCHMYEIGQDWGRRDPLGAFNWGESLNVPPYSKAMFFLGIARASSPSMRKIFHSTGRP